MLVELELVLVLVLVELVLVLVLLVDDVLLVPPVPPVPPVLLAVVDEVPAPKPPPPSLVSRSSTDRLHAASASVATSVIALKRWARGAWVERVRGIGSPWRRKGAPSKASSWPGGKWR